jgi:hypothetical protein
VRPLHDCGRRRLKESATKDPRLLRGTAGHFCNVCNNWLRRGGAKTPCLWGFYVRDVSSIPTAPTKISLILLPFHTCTFLPSCATSENHYIPRTAARPPGGHTKVPVGWQRETRYPRGLRTPGLPIRPLVKRLVSARRLAPVWKTICKCSDCVAIASDCRAGLGRSGAQI